MITWDGKRGYQLAVASNRCRIYVDTYMFAELARPNTGYRERFVRAIRSGGTLLFGAVNAIELGDRTLPPTTALRALLSDVADQWAPLELNLARVIERERPGHPEAELGAIAPWLLLEFCEYRVRNGIEPGPAETFCDLGEFVAWRMTQRTEMQADKVALDVFYKEQVLEKIRSLHDHGGANVDVPTTLKYPANRCEYVFRHLVRTIVLDRSSQAKEGDGADFFHACIAGAYGHVVALDGQWKKRLSTVPGIDAKVYYAPEVEEFVTECELRCAEAASKP